MVFNDTKKEEGTKIVAIIMTNKNPQTLYYKFSWVFTTI